MKIISFIPVMVLLGKILFITLADPHIPTNIIASVLTRKRPQDPVFRVQHVNPPATPTAPIVTATVTDPVLKEPSSNNKHCGFQIVKENQDYNISEDVTIKIPSKIQHDDNVEDINADDVWDDVNTYEETEVERRMQLYDEYDTELAEKEREEEDKRQHMDMLDDLIMDMYSF